MFFNFLLRPPLYCRSKNSPSIVHHSCLACSYNLQSDHTESLIPFTFLFLSSIDPPGLEWRIASPISRGFFVTHGVMWGQGPFTVYVLALSSCLPYLWTALNRLNLAFMVRKRSFLVLVWWQGIVLGRNSRFGGESSVSQKNKKALMIMFICFSFNSICILVFKIQLYCCISVKCPVI